MRNPVGLPIWRCFLAIYPKTYLDISSQINAYATAGLIIDSQPVLEKALSDIGYYRLRGYCFHLYDQSLKQFFHLCNLHSQLNYNVEMLPTVETQKPVIALRISQSTLDKAKATGKGYTGFLSRLLDNAINDPQIVAKSL